MNIQSVIPSQSGIETRIHAVRDNGQNVSFSYSHIHEMLHDPFKQEEWLDGRQISLNDAIQFVLNAN